ncbi:GtrA family protein [Butyrivibrio sp. M55]|uniref:GtrA family protein n=1 Tax=Butyrivibrio sp. M55 TaxID=1855323 RepID=UPI0008F1157C|nr:GtrA family protein [Butyrivibrio sp. M55]SFU85076.1 Putative flippase GtrA (transmembrane translocase of bactoprenol-linked glucose) [Butyrivibrio sp. M55]
MKKEGFLQFIKFGIVGGTNTVIGYLIYVVSLKTLRSLGLFPNIDLYIAQFIMFILSVAWSFYWNNKMVFKREDGEQRNILLALVKTYISYAFTSLILSEILLYLWCNLIGLDDYIAPIINLLITVPLNYFIQKYWAFN